MPNSPESQKPSISIADFDYELPNDRIAYEPTADRAASKLLVWNKTIVAEDHYANIANHLAPNQLLVFNNSKVIAARLLFEKNNTAQANLSGDNVAQNNLSGDDTAQANFSEKNKNSNSIIEIFCLEPTNQFLPVQLAMQANNKVSWICLVGGAKKWKDQYLVKTLNVANKIIELKAEKKEGVDGKFIIEFTWNDPTLVFSEILHLIGKIPLPPYIQREATLSDNERYQTTYAIAEGSVAAPTAGLHFSKPVFQTLAQKNINTSFVTLHVGAGTFLPVKTDKIEDHIMHAEFIEVSKETIEYLATTNESIIAVGTTSLRTLESLYWMGVKIKRNANITTAALALSQWEALELNTDSIDYKEALTCIVEWMHQNNLNNLISSTQLIITPGYTFKVVKGLVTNFHQPKSTLLLIIAAIVGDQWRALYEHALKNEYRFLSYGDGCLLWITPPAK